MVVGQDMRDDDRDALASRDVQEFIGAMGVRVRAEHTSDDKLRLREPLPEHGHERDRAAFAHIGGRRAEGRLGSARQRLFEPRGQGGGVPPNGVGFRRVDDPRPVWRILFQQCANDLAGTRCIQGRRQAQAEFATFNGGKTFPASTGAGSPSMPVTANCGRQVRLSTSSIRSSLIGDMPALNGNFVYTASPSAAEARRACATRSGGNWT